MHAVAAHTGDVVLLSGSLPADHAFSDEIVGRVAHDGAAAVADHLAGHAERLGVELDAVVVEAVR